MEYPAKPLCKTCGTQYPSGQKLPDICTICNDDRQYVTEQGQVWMELDDLAKQYGTKISKVSDNLYALRIFPDFAISQRAFLVTSAHGNILWDCIPLLDEATTEFIRSKGGLKAIAISHPHYYSNMNVWAETFDCPVYIHEADAGWVMHKGHNLTFWKGRSLPILDTEMIHIGGHFPGSCMLKVPSLSPKGAILSGDTLYISKSRRHIAVMYSYPNFILLPKRDFISVLENTKNLEFDTMYGAFMGQDLVGNARQVLDTSMQRYMEDYGYENEH